MGRDEKVNNLTKSWRVALANMVTDPKVLLERLSLDLSLLPAAQQAVKLFPLKVTEAYLARIKVGDMNDPLLKQVLPMGAEFNDVSGYEADPLQEAKVNPVTGLLQKYHGRVLITLTSACAIHCRYCFRRHFPYAENNPGKEGWSEIFNYIAKDQSISEVILSGGDPLVMNDNMLKAFTDQLSSLPQVKTLRFHTRIPIVLPDRITKELISWLEDLRFNVVIVIHANHAQEIDHEVKQGLLRLRQAGVTLLNQSVLLHAVNDDYQILAQLSERLFESGVLPYYLHQLDKVAGAAHFAVTNEKAKAIHRALLGVLPGYLVPRFVQEIPGECSKTPVL